MIVEATILHINRLFLLGTMTVAQASRDEAYQCVTDVVVQKAQPCSLRKRAQHVGIEHHIFALSWVY
jgi:hypothetical protein